MTRKLLWIVGVSAVLIATPLSLASAADMAVKAPPAVPAAAVVAADWTGFTADVDGGWSGNRFNWQLTNPVPPTLTPFSMSSSNGIAGVHLGYQQQWGSIVLGVEAGGAFSLGNAKSASAMGNGTGVGACALTDTCVMSLDPLITGGGKLGYAWQNWLLYGVGGAARSEIHSQFIFANGIVFDSASAGHTGYYVGGGVDYLLSKDVIVGVEYEHVDLGSVCAISSADSGITNCSPGGSNERVLSAKEDIVWAKLTLKFNPWSH